MSDLTAVEAENRYLKERVKSLEDTIAAMSKLYEEKVRYAEEEGTHKKLRDIQNQIAEAVRLFIDRMRKAIETARVWGKDHNVLGHEELLGIIERALPRR